LLLLLAPVCCLLQVRAALVAAFGADATAKLAPLIQKFDDAVNAAGGVEALAAQATDKLNELLPGAGDAVGGLLGAAGGLLGGLTGGGGEGGGSSSRGFGSALFSVALNMLTDPGVMQAVSRFRGGFWERVCEVAVGRGRVQVVSASILL
jgi:hypothetical protein